MAEFELRKTDAGQFNFSLKQDGHTLLRSELYNAKSSALNGIESVRENAVELSRFVLKTSSNGRYFFNLIAANGQVVGTSVLYVDEAARAQAIDSTRAVAPSAKVMQDW